MAIVTAVALDSVSYKFVSVAGNILSLVLVRHYSAHVTASHAQDCPDWKLERPIFPWGSNISLFLFQKTRFL